MGDLSDFREFSYAAIVLGTVLGSVITASLFAYPFTRLYGRNSFAAAAFATVPIAFYDFWSPVENSPFWPAVHIVHIGSLLIFLAVTATLARRELSGTQVVMVAPASRLPAEVGTSSPRTLLLALLPILAIALYVGHDSVQWDLWEVGLAADTRALKRAGLLSGSLLGPALVALMFAFPVAGLYGRRAGAAGALISAPTAANWLSIYLQEDPSPFLAAAYILAGISLLTLVPLAASKARRQLGDTRLAVVHSETNPSRTGAPTSG